MGSLSERDFWLLAGMLVMLALTVAGFVLYQVRVNRLAYLGQRLLDACGGELAAAHREVDNLDEENDIVAGRAFKAARRLDFTNLSSSAPPDRAEVCLDCGHSYGMHHAHNCGGCMGPGCPCPNFRGQQRASLDPVCECGHGRKLHHLERRWCLHGECTCHHFHAIVVQP